MAVSELCKRLCRYLLHRYLGPFLEEKVALDQFHLSLDKGSGTVTGLSLDAAHLNELLAKYHLPFTVVDGYVGSVTVYLPVVFATASISSVLSASAETFSNFGGLRIELSDVQFTVRGLDISESVLMGNSLDLLATSLCCSEFTTPSQSLAIDYSQSAFNAGIAIPLEGLDQLATVIDSIVSQVEIVVKELVIRLEPPSLMTDGFDKDPMSVAAIELHLLKICASLSSKESGKDVKVLCTGIELRAETFKDHEDAEKSGIGESSYIILLRIPDANMSLSAPKSASSTFYMKIVASSLTAFFPGPDILCSFISMLDSIFNRHMPSKHNQTAVFQSIARDDVPSSIMFESCAGSLMSTGQFSFAAADQIISSSPSVHLVLNVVRSTIVVVYNTPKGAVTPQSMSVGFFASLPQKLDSSCSDSRNVYSSCCPAECLIIQLLTSKTEMIFNAQQSIHNFLDSESSHSTLKNPVDLETQLQPLRMCIRFSFEAFDIADCARQNQCNIFTQLIGCKESSDAKAALAAEFRVRFTGFKELNASYLKPCQADINITAVVNRLFPLINSVVRDFKDNSPRLIRKPTQVGNSMSFTCNFDKISFQIQFPKRQNLNFVGEAKDASNCHPEILTLEAEKLELNFTRLAPISPFSDARNEFSVDCYALNGYLLNDGTETCLFGMTSLKVEIQKNRSDTVGSVLLFADPPMRLHNGRELHVATQNHLSFSQNDLFFVDIGVLNVLLPPANTVRLLSDRIRELQCVVVSLRKLIRTETEQSNLEKSILTTGSSIYYSMSSSSGNQPVLPSVAANQSSDITFAFGIHCHKLLVSIAANKSDQVRRSELFASNAVALLACDLALDFSKKSGWFRIGSLNVLDAFMDPSKSGFPGGGIEFSTPIVRSSIPLTQTSVSSSLSSSDCSSSKTCQTPSVIAVWNVAKKRAAIRFNTISLDFCSQANKLPPSVQILCDAAAGFEKEFSDFRHSNTNQQPQKSLSSSKWQLCLEGSSISLYIRTKSDGDIDGLGSKQSSLPGLCFSFENIFFDASPTAKVGDIWFGLASSTIELCLRINDQDSGENESDRERMFQADWLEFTIGMSSSRGSTSFFDVTGSSVSMSATVNNLSALSALIATFVGGLRNSSFDPPSPGVQEEFSQGVYNPDFETPAELRDALKESGYMFDAATSPNVNGYSSPLSSLSGGRDSLEDGEFLILSSSLVKKLPRNAECHKLAPNSIPFRVVDNHLKRPTHRPDPLGIQPQGWPTPVFRFTLRDTTLKCILATDRGDAFEVSLIRTSVRYERCPIWTPNLYRVAISVHDVEVTERLGSDYSSQVILRRLVTDDVPKIQSAPQILFKIAVVRSNSFGAVPLLKQSAVSTQDTECDVRLSLQPIKVKVSKRTVDIVHTLSMRLSGLCNSASQASLNSEHSNSSPTPSIGLKSPAQHRLVGEMGRGRPVLFDETGSTKSSNITPISSGVFIRSFAIQPSLIVEVNFSGSIPNAGNVPIHLEKCRLVLPSLMETRCGFTDAGRLVDYVIDHWKNAASDQKRAIVTAGTGLNKLPSSVQELASATADLGALILAPICNEDLPLAFTNDSQLRPGRVLRGLTSSAANLSADVATKLLSTAFPLLQQASQTASNLISHSSIGIPISKQQTRSYSPELKSLSSSSSSSLTSRERKNSRNTQDEALRKAANSALLAGQQIETSGTIIAQTGFD